MNIVDRTHKYMRNGKWRTRKVSAIKHIVVHHTAAKTGGNNDDKLERFAREHMARDKGIWPGLSYHYMIMADGTIYKLNNHEDVTYVDGINVDCLAICLDGFFHPDVNEQPSRAQLNSLQDLLNDLCNNHPEFPASQRDVKGHRDRASTACPGNNLYPYVKEYRDTGNISIASQSQSNDQTTTIPHMTPVSSETKQYLLQVCGESHAQYILGATYNFDFNLLGHDYADRCRELQEARNQLTQYVNGNVSIDQQMNAIATERDEFRQQVADLMEENTKLKADAIAAAEKAHLDEECNNARGNDISSGAFKLRSDKLKAILGWVKNILPTAGLGLAAVGVSQTDVNQILSFAGAGISFALAFALELDKTKYNKQEDEIKE